MNLRAFETIHPDLLPGLVNTSLRNDCEDLEDLCRTHDLDQEFVEARLGELGYAYVEGLRQFRQSPINRTGDSLPLRPSTDSTSQ
ncbi:MAG: hypothetical protein B9S36_03155 [Verrucomicrobiia bacterium Tous-C2TDCM]|nr:MAG: hypothetical protein B9S36_03155 [Verrucomicrobiae bacterium Tous-C2TDCM]